MSFKINLNDVKMENHPKFDGVKIGFIVTKKQHPELSITILEIAPNIQIPLHTHEKEIDSIFILEGEGEIFMNNEWISAKAGDIIVVGNKELHGLKAMRNTLRCYVIHAPALW